MNLRKCFAAVAFIVATVTPGFACSCIFSTLADGFAQANGTTKYSPQVCNWGTQLRSSKMSLVPNGPAKWIEDWVLMDQGQGKAPKPVTSGRVEGQTRDFLGALVPKAVVVFRKRDFTHEVISDESGTYQIDLPAGVYEVTVEKFNIFDAYRRKNVKVQNGRLKKFDVVLKYDVKKYPPITLRDEKPRSIRLFSGEHRQTLLSSRI